MKRTIHQGRQKDGNMNTEDFHVPGHVAVPRLSDAIFLMRL